MRRREGFIYICLRADGLRKLGWTANIDRRVKVLSQIVGIEHVCERLWDAGGNVSAYRIEQKVHSIFYRSRVSPEVYCLSLDTLSTEVEKAIKQIGTGMFSTTKTLPPFVAWNVSLIDEANAQLEADPSLMASIIKAGEAAVERLRLIG